MLTPIFLGFVKNGKLIFKELELFKTYLHSLEGKSLDIIVRLVRKGRTTKQNSWYWACVVGIPAEHYGYLPEEMHDCYKWMFLRMHEEGKPETVKSTTLLSTVEFSEFVEKCRQWAAEQGFNIPDPTKVELG